MKFSLALARRILIAGTSFILSGYFLTLLQEKHFRTKLVPLLPGRYLDLQGEDVSDLGLRCQSCALVATSGHLLSSGAGFDIDGHSCVFRIGFGTTKGREKDLGTKTSLRIVDSTRFYPFLKRPKKLWSSTLAAGRWLLYDRRPGDISRLHGPRLRKPLHGKGDPTVFFWVSKEAEREALRSLERLRSGRRTTEASGLWYSLPVTVEAGCASLTFYGLPHAKICKSEWNVSLPSLYWDNSSPPLCHHGIDAGAQRILAKAPPQYPTTYERRVLQPWLRENLPDTTVTFRYPSWPP